MPTPAKRFEFKGFEGLCHTRTTAARAAQCTCCVFHSATAAHGTSPADTMAAGNASACSSVPIFHVSPRAAALVSERRQQASGGQAAQQLTTARCWIVRSSGISPSRPSVGLRCTQHAALSATGVSPRAVAVSGMQHSSELVAAQQLARWCYEWLVA